MTTSGIPQTSVDLFAGCGGLSLGLHQSGWQGIFATEKDPMAFETLRQNMLRDDASYPGFDLWPDWLPKTASGIDELLDSSNRDHLAELRGTVGLIAGGPPCQGFSVGGRRNAEDDRNQLVHRMLEMVEIVRSPLVLIENVEGITRRFIAKSGGRREEAVADQVVARLDELGYDAAYSIVDASHFGVPQARRRVLIVGFHRGVIGFEASRFPEALDSIRVEMLRNLRLPYRRQVTVREAIEDLAGERKVECPDSPRFMSTTYRSEPPGSAYGRLMRRGIKGDVPDSHRLSKHGDRIRALYETAHATQRPGRLPKSFLLSQGTKKDKKVLLDAGAPASTITTHPDEFIHYREPRNVTVREMARLQSFPDDFTFHGRYTINGPRRPFDVARCSQVGNAVPPLLGRAIGLALLAVAAGRVEVGAPRKDARELVFS